MTADFAPLLLDLLCLPGVAGNETPVAERLHQAWDGVVDAQNLDPLGNLIAVRHGSGSSPRPKIMVAAHMDSVGFRVRGIVDSFLQIAQVGRFDDRLLPGEPVTVHGTRAVPGLIVAPPRSCLPENLEGGVVPTRYLLVDLGLPAPEVRRIARAGDVVSFARPPQILEGSVIVGHSLDNRASLAAITVCLESLANRQPAWDVFAVATVQEETTAIGALAAAESLGPTAAIVLDVTYGYAYAEMPHASFPLGGGPTNAWSPEVHPEIYREIDAAAERSGIPVTREVLPEETGTDARGLLLAKSGVPLGVLSIPLRYMHNPAEVVMLSDIERTGMLLTEFISGLDEGFLARLGMN